MGEKVIEFKDCIDKMVALWNNRQKEA